MFSGPKLTETEIYRRLIFLWERAFLNGAQAFQVSVQDGSLGDTQIRPYVDT